MTDRASVAISKSTEAADALIGRVIGGRFKIAGLIARGGMGKVYRAEQAPLGRVCAVKVLNPSYAGEHDPEFHKRFFLEASIASRLSHPNTVTIFDYGRTDDDVYYMAMEYLDGQTLHRAIREAGNLPQGRVVHIARQICRALREAHELGVIHRDLKPANIFLVEHGDEADFVKVLDFGLVKLADNKGEDLTQTGMFMGSPKYMSPEQIRGDRVDARSDVYALGIILYEMLTGKVPFDRPNSVNILMAHVGEEAPPMREMNPDIDVSAELDEVVSRCMAKDPERRLRSMDDVLSALKRVAGGVGSAPITGLEPTERAPISGSGSGAQPGRASVAAASVPVRSTRVAGAVSSRVPPAAPSDSPLPGALATPARTGSNGVLVAAVAGTLAVAGAIGYVALRPPSPAVIAAPAPPPSKPAGPLAEPVPILAAPVTAKLHVTTDPDGASVKEDGVELCSATPCEVLYKGADADPAREHKLTLTRAGYRAETRTTKGSDALLAVKLAPTATARSAPAAVAPPRPESPPPAAPPGYKTDIPY